VAVAERSTFGVLTGKSNRRPRYEQGGEGERFGGSPVDDPALLDGVFAALDWLRKLAVERKSLGHAGQRFAPCDELAPIDGRQRGAAKGVASRHLATVDVRRSCPPNGSPRPLQTLHCIVRHRARAFGVDRALI